MIHPALYKLMGMQFRAIGRRMVRGEISRRILVFLLGAALCVGWLFLASATTIKTRTDPQRVRNVMPIVLLGICVVSAITSAGDKAIAFTSGEVDQLFPGPFTRRELLAYKLMKSTFASILTAAVLSVVMLRHAQWWPGCFTAIFFSLLFVQLFSITLLLVGQSMGTAANTRLKKFVMIAAGLIILIGARKWLAMGEGGGEAAIDDFRASTAGAILIAPFEPFGHLMTATTALDLLKWAGLAAALNGGLLVVVFLLDAHYIETAIAASERRYAKIKRVRAGAFLSMGVSKTSHWHLPQFPWAGGAGPIAWRQMTNAARSSRGLLLLLLIVAVGAAPALSAAGRGGRSVEILLGVMGWLTFLCSNMLNFDFRGDIDHLENLKALPLTPNAVAIGQLVTPVLVLSGFHMLVLGIATLLVSVHRDWLVIALAASVPFNAILFGTENFIFLLFPSRPAAVSPGDFQVLGRKFVFFLGKLIILLTCIIVAFVAAGLVWIFTNPLLAPAAIVGWMILSCEAAAMIPLIAWAYRRFDPSIHVAT